MPGVDFMVRVVGLGCKGPEFKSHSAVELIPGGVNSACHPSKVVKMSASILVSCVRVELRFKSGFGFESETSLSDSSPLRDQAKNDR